MNDYFNFEYKVIGDIKKIRGKKILGIFTTRHATNYSKKIIKDIVINFHETYSFMMTIETFQRLSLQDYSSCIILVQDFECIRGSMKKSSNTVYLKCDINELKLRYLYKDLFIANKADSILILEATKYSKNLNILSLYAQEISKDVFVLPGRIDSESSKGANKLIFDGANPFYTLDLLKM